jgi:hypothetical protein
MKLTRRGPDGVERLTVAGRAYFSALTGAVALTVGAVAGYGAGLAVAGLAGLTADVRHGFGLGVGTVVGAAALLGARRPDEKK